MSILYARPNNMIKKLSLSVVLLISGILTPHQNTYAITMLPDPRKESAEPSSNNFLESIYSEIGGSMAPLYGWAIDIFTITFLVGTIVMILSIMFKNGQWQKYAQSTMLITFIVMLLMRGVPIIMLSITSPDDIDMMLLSGVNVLGVVAIFIAAISLPISMLFKFGYHLIEHPKYHRWSRNLLSVAALMTALALIIPWFSPQI